MIGLTRRQADCLAAIEALTKDGVPPSFEEIREAMGLASKSGAHRLVHALVQRGHVRVLPLQARSIEIIRKAA